MKKSLNSADFYCEVYNLGVDGDYSENLLKRFEFEADQRAYDKKETIIIFAIGVNDSQIGNIGISPEKFRKNIEKLYKLSLEYSSKIIFVGLTTVDKLKTNPIPRSMTSKCYKNKYIKKYDEIIKSVCREKDIYFIDMLSEFSKLNYKKLLEDGLHPNVEGHKKMFGIIKDFLAKNKIV